MDIKVRKSVGELDKKIRNLKFLCLHPRCDHRSIGSHSQHRAGQLNEIQREGFVYSFNRSAYSAVLGNYEEFTLTSIKNASVFPGYCSAHDSQLFAPIENESLVRNDNKQASLFFLRAVSYELTQKRLVKEWEEGLLSKCSDELYPQHREFMRIAVEGRNKFINVELPYYLDAAFDVLDNNGDRLVTEWIVLDGVLPASSCTVFSPILDFEERTYDRAYGNPQAIFSFNLVPLNGETHVIVSWLKEHDQYSSWLRSEIHDDPELFINRMAICESEDICLNPDYWENIAPEMKMEIYHAMSHDVFRGNLEEIPRLIRI